MAVNGRIPLGELSPMPGEAGAYLSRDAAVSWGRLVPEVVARFGWRPQPTSIGDAYRSLDRQVNVFRQRYRTVPSQVWQGGRWVTDRRVWNGVPYWRFTGAAAAVPGTSNHGWGIAVDGSSLRYGTARFNQFAIVANAHGWSNVEGRSVGEAWHWTYNRAHDKHYATTVNNPGSVVPDLNIPTVGEVLPVLIEEDIVASIQDLDAALEPLERDIAGLKADIAGLARSNGFRFDSEGTVYYANLATGAFYAVPDPEYHSVLIGIEGDVLQVNPRQRDLIRSMCRRAADSIAGVA